MHKSWKQALESLEKRFGGQLGPDICVVGCNSSAGFLVRGFAPPRVLMGMYWDNGKEDGKENGNYYNVGFILGLYWRCIGIMEKKMETTITM